jgi:hypothetical protein
LDASRYLHHYRWQERDAILAHSARATLATFDGADADAAHREALAPIVRGVAKWFRHLL